MADEDDRQELESWDEVGLAALEIRLRTSGLKVTRYEHDPRILAVEVPNGRNFRTIYIDAGEVDEFDSIPLEKIHFVGQYEAIVNVETGEIEAELISGGHLIATLRRRLSAVPGVEIISDSEISENTDEVRDDGIEAGRRVTPENWKLILKNKSISLEFSPHSLVFSRVVGRSRRTSVTIKITGAQTTSERDTLAFLETTVGAALFDFDLRYNIPMDLRRVRPTRYRVPNRPRSAVAPAFPQNKYAAKPLALYRYGRSATNLPLLEFLAYYQVLEFFFAMFSGEQLIRQLRTALRDPYFNLDDDLTMGPIISLLQPQGRGRLSENEQLRIVVQASVTAEFLRGFITSSGESQKHFCDKPLIKGVEKLSLNTGAADLRDQVADRIYAIRCRVVHTKQDGGDSGVDLLLPSSPEVEALGPDIDLVRVIAQQALIAGASTLH